MPKSYCSIGIEDIKQILSAIFGESKRIPLMHILMDIEDDDSVKNAKTIWRVSEENVKDHFGILQGVLIIEASLQSIICIVESLRLFPNHKPVFLGLEKFDIFAPVYAGDELLISIENITWQGKKGSAMVNASCKENKIATIGNLRFRANSERASRRFGLEQKVA